VSPKGNVADREKGSLTLDVAVTRIARCAAPPGVYPQLMALLSCPQALAIVAEKMRTLADPRTERVTLEAAQGRVLAEPIFADRDQPPFPRSTRDGYAVFARNADKPMRLIGSIRAGEQWSGKAMHETEIIEIMTGAPVPDVANAVVMLEHVTVDGDFVTLQPDRSIKVGENIVPRGAEAREGDRLLRSGVRMGPAEMALAASVGATELSVYVKPTVAILSTGDELVEVHETPAPMQIRNSNSHGLAALVRANGGVPRMLPPAADTRESLHAAIAAARDAEILVLSGGVSAGKYDFVEEALLAFGAEFFFTGVAMQPGKPAVFGRTPPDDLHAEQWVFGLPGNPVSTQVTAMLFAMPMLRALAGECAWAEDMRVPPQPFFAQARLTQAVQVRSGLTRFLPALLTSSLAGATVQTTGWQGSGDLNANARANCYLVVPPGAESMSVADVATVLLR
jgi:molybdopterin molybdotransferase